MFKTSTRKCSSHKFLYHIAPKYIQGAVKKFLASVWRSGTRNVWFIAPRGGLGKRPWPGFGVAGGFGSADTSVNSRLQCVHTFSVGFRKLQPGVEWIDVQNTHGTSCIYHETAHQIWAIAALVPNRCNIFFWIRWIRNFCTMSSWSSVASHFSIGNNKRRFDPFSHEYGYEHCTTPRISHSNDM